jgi:hypothetical protein
MFGAEIIPTSSSAERWVRRGSHWQLIDSRIS